MALPIGYHWRNLFIRKTTTLLTLLIIAAVVGVFAWMLGFSDAMRGALAVAGDPRTLVVLKRGATAESNSAIPVDEYNKLSQVSAVAREAQSGEALISPEMMVQVSLPRVRDGGRTFANVAVRGVTETAFAVHVNVKPVGRVFSTAEREVIVGQKAAEQFAGLNVGDELMLGYGGDRRYRVVGRFTADGGPMESEIWGYLPSLMNSYNRTMYSSAYLRLEEGADAEAVIEQIEGPAIQLSAQSEPAYWAGQTRLMDLYRRLSFVLVGVMCLAAVFSIANTMFSVVAGRTREIAMLRTIGFTERHVTIGLIVESVFLSLVGGVIGCAGCLAWLSFVGNTKDLFGGNTFTTMAFEIRLSPVIAATALGLVVLVGVFGAWVPARRAARLPVVEALREP